MPVRFRLFNTIALLSLTFVVLFRTQDDSSANALLTKISEGPSFAAMRSASHTYIKFASYLQKTLYAGTTVAAY